MPIADDWSIDYVNKIISHVDGRLAYGSNTGTAPGLNDYIIQATTGAEGNLMS